MCLAPRTHHSCSPGAWATSCTSRLLRQAPPLCRHRKCAGTSLSIVELLVCSAIGTQLFVLEPCLEGHRIMPKELPEISDLRATCWRTGAIGLERTSSLSRASRSAGRRWWGSRTASLLMHCQYIQALEPNCEVQDLTLAV